MSLDKDQVRVDLLKFRRKAYLSYSEGSPERKKFLKTILENELRLTEKEIPQPLIDFLIEGDKLVFWDSFKKFFPWFLGSLLCACIFGWFHNLLSSFFIIPGAVCAAIGIGHIDDYLSYQKSMKAVEKYSNDMKKYMSRISNDIKRLEGPHGH